MQLTTDQKRKFIKLIAIGKADARNFKAIPERHFTRASAMPLQDEISVNGVEGVRINIKPDTVFMCRQDRKKYTYSQIQEIAGNAPFVNISCSVADNPPTEPAAIDEIEIIPVSANERINYFLNNNH